MLLPRGTMRCRSGMLSRPGADPPVYPNVLVD